MKKRNAFTLVELLAVIVILAIVLIIAVPGVLSIINKTKDSAYDRQIDMIKNAAKNYVTANTVTWSGDNPKSTLVTLNMLQSGGYLDKKILDPRDKKEILCANVLVTKDNKNKITYDVDMTCNDIQPITPRVGSGMIPIVYDGTNWRKADSSNKDFAWFNYGNQQWANIATVTEATRKMYQNASVGTEVKMEDINAMYVWIPRYRYQLWNVDNTTTYQPTSNWINVQFEEASHSKATGTQNGEWLTHPAFTFGEEELEGFWMGKFETSSLEGNGDSYEADDVTTKTPIVKPGISSWAHTTLATFFKNTKQMTIRNNQYGLENTQDAHPIKNMEWGAMAYLTYSSYGKTGNNAYSGDDKQVRINNNLSFLTGCAATNNDEWGNNVCNSYETTIGQGASTTGNITGVYDTSGGRWEVAMVLVYTDDTHTNVITDNTGLTEADLATIDPKYFDYYDPEESNVNPDQEYQRGHLGDATKELGKFIYKQASLAAYSAWYHDYAHVVTTLRPLQMRGGDFNRAYWSGTTAFVLSALNGTTDAGYRIIIT